MKDRGPCLVGLRAALTFPGSPLNALALPGEAACGCPGLALKEKKA